jgi:dihydrofolate reductase
VGISNKQGVATVPLDTSSRKKGVKIGAVIVVAVAKNPKNGKFEVIGKDGKIPWSRISSDRRRFWKIIRQETTVVGRKTYESLPKRKLNENYVDLIVVTRTPPEHAPAGVRFACSYEEAYEMPWRRSQLFVIGGAQIYKAAIEHGRMRRMLMTYVRAEIEGDTFFPHVPDPEKLWDISNQPSWGRATQDEYETSYVEWIRHT